LKANTTSNRTDDGDAIPAAPENLVQLFSPTLFDHAGIDTPFHPRSRNSADCTDHYVDIRTGWVVHVATPDPRDCPVTEPELPAQYFLGFQPSGPIVSSIISPSNRIFMNATIRSAFRASRAQCEGARRLMEQDILYLGDLTRFSRDEIIARLGQYAAVIEAIDGCLEDAGLSFSTVVRWWVRPDDYYQRAL
jgi:hypothetical protein